MDERDLTRTEAARYLGVTAQHLANLANQRRGPKFAKREGRTFYTRKALDDWTARR